MSGRTIDGVTALAGYSGGERLKRVAYLLGWPVTAASPMKLVPLPGFDAPPAAWLKLGRRAVIADPACA